MAGRFLEDDDAYKKPIEKTALTKPGSPLVKSSKYLGLNLSDQKNKKSNTKKLPAMMITHRVKIIKIPKIFPSSYPAPI